VRAVAYEGEERIKLGYGTFTKKVSPGHAPVEFRADWTEELPYGVEFEVGDELVLDSVTLVVSNVYNQSYGTSYQVLLKGVPEWDESERLERLSEERERERQAAEAETEPEKKVEKKKSKPRTIKGPRYKRERRGEGGAAG
jgi:hypothetical protein